MRPATNLFDIAIKYHEALPARIRQYLNSRGIPDEIIETHLLGWNGWRITIPITNREGDVALFRLAKDPQDARPAPKMLSSPGAKVELYGWYQVLKKPQQIIVCEGEFDRLVLEANGFAAVTSTAGAATFRPEWASALASIKNVYICFDRDNAGQTGARVAGLMIPQARCVVLPEDFLELLNKAPPFAKLPQSVPPHPTPVSKPQNTPTRARVERIKHNLPIDKVAGRYVKLQQSGRHLVGLCPFHQDRIASLTLYSATDTYYCFGCRRYGDVIRFIQDIEHLSFA